ncbi:hypothetical protein CEXT_318671 [Caerostris extrusa]|uniref:Maturase K n=1 Tax=Caerostris extrusa TaxID=172846 RepID=A0AAV4TSN1_CAEEX|nr:hypothetical protein CEXT_318671 [Caerostris extrusa]
METQRIFIRLPSSPMGRLFVICINRYDSYLCSTSPNIGLFVVYINKIWSLMDAILSVYNLWCEDDWRRYYLPCSPRVTNDSKLPHPRIARLFSIQSVFFRHLKTFMRSYFQKCDGALRCSEPLTAKLPWRDFPSHLMDGTIN